MYAEVVDEADVQFARRVDRKALASVTREMSQVSNARALWALASQWLVIAACFTAVVMVDRWWAWPIAALIIASRQHAMLALMHEAAHYHFLSNRAVGDVVSDFLCAFPLNMTTAGYRHEHMLHHRYVNTPQDPYWAGQMVDASWHFPRTPLRAAAVFMADALGLYAPNHLKVVLPWTYWGRLVGKANPKISAFEHVRYWLYVATLVTVLVTTGAWLHWLFLWVLPTTTVMMAFFRMRALGEHPIEPNPKGDETRETRDVEGTALENFFVAPLNVNYHLTHHAFPSVPFYNLPVMHKELEKAGLLEPGVNMFDSYLGPTNSIRQYITREREPSATMAVAAASQQELGQPLHS
ncbi:fatty acid desaturase family protein [Pyxidicoccus caerfyrddinensis]|uniref:fatty acid desaturase family protein n=1 Tax=Pyxidicoccus caerfyrddinensis TaxID=2709663 RepID=UPI0013DC4C61|nr:fatty acid desaturase family protein [Pyxidicoccus caerfyrddinensis]